MNFETLNVRREGAVVFAEIEAPPMNLLGPELVRDLVSLIQRVETEDAVQVLVFTSADPDYFISHVDVTRIVEYRHEAASTPNWNVATACPSSFLRRHGAEQLCFITISRAELARRVGAVV